MERKHVVLVDEGDGDSVTVGTCRTADAVDIILGIVGNIVVDDHCDVIDVNASRENVRGHQHINLATLELEHHLVALRLVEVGVHLATVDFHPQQSLVDLLHLHFAAREDNDTLQVTGLENLLDNLQFLCLIANVGALLDFLSGLADSQLDLYGVLQQVLGHLLNVFRHGG